MFDDSGLCPRPRDTVDTISLPSNCISVFSLAMAVQSVDQNSLPQLIPCRVSLLADASSDISFGGHFRSLESQQGPSKWGFKDWVEENLSSVLEVDKSLQLVWRSFDSKHGQNDGKENTTI